MKWEIYREDDRCVQHRIAAIEAKHRRAFIAAAKAVDTRDSDYVYRDGLFAGFYGHIWQQAKCDGTIPPEAWMNP